MGQKKATPADGVAKPNYKPNLNVILYDDDFLNVCCN